MYSPTGLEINASHAYPKNDNQAAGYPEDGLHVDNSYYGRNGGVKTSGDEKEAVVSSQRRMCGLSRKTFWILVAATIVIIAAAALGGGLGGGLSHNKDATTPSQQTSAPPPQQTSPLPPQQTSGIPSSNTGTASASASTASPIANLVVSAQVGTVNGSPVTLYRDCPSTNESLYSVEYSSTTYEFRKLCNSTFMNGGQQAGDWVNQPASSLNDCINLCAAWNENNVTKGNADQVCSSVCWRYAFAGDDFPGQCFGSTIVNDTSGGFSFQNDGRCDSAAWINQS